ncbi:monovalent cation/proton antiporter subunit, putative [Pusillimonas sp. T7-7]|uniref:Na(+)/H(+) antiporter subunit B n=1 Tax=Pusillimonas sp. (strain T7-7) TaxID=1007105 RepID=UPI0002085808|nr:Na(+)/H(+) antiporter subunit B [Pusillimonas sp. T7-7]AEC19763.1 monovalent cation/proton antiporter subunit, putative [Pusillimonas sp. T7-7]
MNSIIFRVGSSVILPFALLLSLFLLWRGHNEPGGGFIGGLVAAAGYASYALPRGHTALRKVLPISPMLLLALGLSAALASGLAGLIGNAAYLTHAWIAIGGVAVGTTLLFDIGVYLTVLGAILTFLSLFLEQ